MGQVSRRNKEMAIDVLSVMASDIKFIAGSFNNVLDSDKAISDAKILDLAKEIIKKYL